MLEDGDRSRMKRTNPEGISCGTAARFVLTPLRIGTVFFQTLKLEAIMPAGANQKREREYEQLQNRFKKEGRYQGREEEVAARIVNKQRSQYGETRAEKQKDREGKSPDRGLPIKDYQTLTIAQIRDQLDELSPKDIKKLRSYEASHKNRKGMMEIFDKQMKNAPTLH